MDWKKRARTHIAEKKWTLETISAAYNSAAKRRGMVRVSKNDDKSEHVISPAALSHWLTGRREPRISEFLALAEALEMPPEHLLAGQNLITPSPGPGAVKEALRAILADPELTSRALAFSAKMAARAPKPKKPLPTRRK